MGPVAAGSSSSDITQNVGSSQPDTPSHRMEHSFCVSRPGCNTVLRAVTKKLALPCIPAVHETVVALRDGEATERDMFVLPAKFRERCFIKHRSRLSERRTKGPGPTSFSMG